MKQMKQSEFRKLPSVDQLLQMEAAARLIERHGRALTLDALRAALDAARQAIQGGQIAPDAAALLAEAAGHLAAEARPSLYPVINASGVIIHTNLGRVPLSARAIAAMQAIGQGYSNLEYDLDEGGRGSRYTHAADLLRRLTGAEDALLVNNNAAAVLLVLSALARERAVLISRSQLIEIGGGFRIPDVLRQSGARLVEVGTTNRTYVHDFADALPSLDVALILRVHHSNFRITGFVHEPTPAELVALGQQRGIPVVDDMGSGTLLDTERYGLAHEPTIQESLTAGVALVTASGDKLLGGPQAGLILGRADMVAQLRRHPLARALRVGKSTLAARLRAADPPVIARIEGDRLLLDPRTVLPEQDAALIKVLRVALAAGA